MKGNITSKRSNIQIIGDILRLGGSGKTRMMYSANMSHAQMEKYLDFLLNRGFLEPVNGSRYNNGKGRIVYQVTEEGKNLLNNRNVAGIVIIEKMKLARIN